MSEKNPEADPLVRWPTPDEVLAHVRAGGHVRDAFDFGRPTSPLELGEVAFLETRRQQADQITGALGIPPALLHDSPDNPRRRYVGIDLASGPDLSAFRWYIHEGGRVGIRMVTEGFERFARSLEDLGQAIRGADDAFGRFWWATLTKAQRRRAGKRLIREEIARRRMEKNRAD